MGAGETFALFAVVGGFIAVTILIGRMFQGFMAYKERQLVLTADRTAEKAAQYAAQVEQLEARMRVLERIATDQVNHGGNDLAREIDGLRVPAIEGRA